MAYRTNGGTNGVGNQALRAHEPLAGKRGVPRRGVGHRFTHGDRGFLFLLLFWSIGRRRRQKRYQSWRGEISPSHHERRELPRTPCLFIFRRADSSLVIWGFKAPHLRVDRWLILHDRQETNKYVQKGKRKEKSSLVAAANLNRWHARMCLTVLMCIDRCNVLDTSNCTLSP